MKDKVKSSSGINMGVLGWLFIVLFWLKMNPGGNYTTPVADWSWWLVAAPIWIPLVVALIVLAIAGIFYAVANKD